jgi:hypothetical protein
MLIRKRFYWSRTQFNFPPSQTLMQHALPESRRNCRHYTANKTTAPRYPNSVSEIWGLVGTGSTYRNQKHVHNSKFPENCNLWVTDQIIHYCAQVYFSRTVRDIFNNTSNDQWKKKKKTPWPEAAIELYRPSDCRLSAKLVPTSADRGVSRCQRGRIPYGRTLSF